MVDEVQQLQILLIEVVNTKRYSPEVLEEAIKQLDYLIKKTEEEPPSKANKDFLMFVREWKSFLLNQKNIAEREVKELQQLREDWWRALSAIKQVSEQDFGALTHVKSYSMTGQHVMPPKLKRTMNDLAKEQKHLIDLTDQMIQSFKEDEKFRNIFLKWYPMGYHRELKDTMIHFLERIKEFNSFLPRAADMKIEKFRVRGKAEPELLDQKYGETRIFDDLSNLSKTYKRIHDQFTKSDTCSVDVMKTLIKRAIQVFDL